MIVAEIIMLLMQAFTVVCIFATMVNQSQILAELRDLADTLTGADDTLTEDAMPGETLAVVPRPGRTSIP